MNLKVSTNLHDVFKDMNNLLRAWKCYRTQFVHLIAITITVEALR